MFSIFWRWKIWYFWTKKLIEIWYLLITEKFLFRPFRQREIRSFLSQKVDGKMIFTDYWKALVLNFSMTGNRSFFESRSWLKDDIYWLLKSSCFELSGDGKYGLFFSQKVDGKMIFPWSFLAFHDIPGLGKYGFSRSDCTNLTKLLIVKDWGYETYVATL